MKHTATAFILTLIFPALCFGHTVLNPNPELTVPETTGWEMYHLEVRQPVQASRLSRLDSGLALSVKEREPFFYSPIRIDAGLPVKTRTAPRDMVSMVSFLWSEMFGGVDIVAEAREFAWQLRSRRNRTRTARVKRMDERSRWSLVIACCVDDRMELGARFNNRGRLFGESGMAVQVKAVDSRTSEMGLIMSYSDNGLSLKADSISLADAAEIKLSVKF